MDSLFGKKNTTKSIINTTKSNVYLSL